MCGIFGIITNQQDIAIGKIALEAIKRLEYRGYDSCGIVTQYNGELFIKKDAGKINEIHQKLKLDVFPNGSKIALAHTRWATHGAPIKINSHPHVDCSGKIAVVHNGIIDNFIELKSELRSKGHIFISETDTEIIPHFIEDFMNVGFKFREAVIEAVKKCTGAYALVVCHADIPNCIIAVKKKSPLVVGIEEGKTSYCASDIPAFLPLTRECFILNDDEMAILQPGSIDFFDVKSNSKVDKKIQHIEWSIDAAEKGGYEHFMLKEIYEEPAALRNTLQIPGFHIKAFATALLNADYIYITAAGTSFYASLAGKFIISRFLGQYIQAIECSEFHTQLSNSLQDNSVIIAVS
ncbi:MAG: glutamine--fructose-6-phosphate aminotransferase, partial [Candidatus Thorarchaeota archaeon]